MVQAKKGEGIKLKCNATGVIIADKFLNIRKNITDNNLKFFIKDQVLTLFWKKEGNRMARVGTNKM